MKPWLRWAAGVLVATSPLILFQNCGSASMGTSGAPSSGSVQVLGSTPTPSPTSSPVPSFGGTIVRSVYVNYIGWEDNSNSSQIANPQLHSVATEDLGTYDRPITLAADPNIVPFGGRIYIPSIRKYFINEDECPDCVAAAGAGIILVDAWIGKNSGPNGQPTLSNCEAALTNLSTYTDTIVLNPDNAWPVDQTRRLSDSGVCYSKLYPVP